MTSIKQIEANRRNALRSTGPYSEQGKKRSRCNAMRHGLTAETVIGHLEDEADYQAFEAAVTADYDVETAVERELVLRLASLLWRLRRATAIETGLFISQGRLNAKPTHSLQPSVLSGDLTSTPINADDHTNYFAVQNYAKLARSFLHLMNAPHYALDRLSRYESNLWRQASHILLVLGPKKHYPRRRRGNEEDENWQR